MICFEVTINGKKTYTAGVKDGVLDFSLIAQTDKDEAKHFVHASLSGLTTERGSEEYPWWGDLTFLSAGDVVTVRIISADSADEPTRRERKKGTRKKRRDSSTSSE
jgi:hypothetical protein